MAAKTYSQCVNYTSLTSKDIADAAECDPQTVTKIGPNTKQFGSVQAPLNRLPTCATFTSIISPSFVHTILSI
ncbi:hypothetical protein BDW71DRAFT_181088 [Aspergillus fruticulosus]